MGPAGIRMKSPAIADRRRHLADKDLVVRRVGEPIATQTGMITTTTGVNTTPAEKADMGVTQPIYNNVSISATAGQAATTAIDTSPLRPTMVTNAMYEVERRTTVVGLLAA